MLGDRCEGVGVALDLREPLDGERGLVGACDRVEVRVAEPERTERIDHLVPKLRPFSSGRGVARVDVDAHPAVTTMSRSAVAMTDRTIVFDLLRCCRRTQGSSIRFRRSAGRRAAAGYSPWDWYARSGAGSASALPSDSIVVHGSGRRARLRRRNRNSCDIRSVGECIAEPCRGHHTTRGGTRTPTAASRSTSALVMPAELTPMTARSVRSRASPRKASRAKRSPNGCSRRSAPSTTTGSTSTEAGHRLAQGAARALGSRDPGRTLARESSGCGRSGWHGRSLVPIRATRAEGAAA